jgi:hypothetical protein
MTAISEKQQSLAAADLNFATVGDIFSFSSRG